MAKHKPIQEFYAYFVDNLKVDKLLHYLREKKWLTLDESETLNSGQLTSRQKAEKILLLMPRKSTASFKAEEILIECAIWSGQSQLAKLLGYNDYEIQEINKKNPSATMAVNDAPGHGYADYQPSHTGYTGQTSYTGWSQGYGQPFAYYTGPAGIQQGYVQQGGATGYSSSNDRGVKVGPSTIIYSQEDDPDDGIQMLAELLRKSGVDCDIDQYHTNDKIANWDRWWERKVREIAEQNGFILLVCSITLRKCLSNNERIQMKEGSISSLLLSSSIEDRHTTAHIIPVFLDQYNADYMPLSLLQRKCYALMLHSVVDFDLETITFHHMATVPEFACLVSLVYKLTGQPEVEKPPVAQIPRIPRPEKAKVHGPVQESMEQSAPSDQVTDQDILHFVSMIRTNNKSWSKLAVRLKVPMKKINEIRSTHHHSHDEACKAMLRTWIAEKPNPLTKTELESLIRGL